MKRKRISSYFEWIWSSCRRVLAAIIENNINDRNEITIPEPLQGMMGSDLQKYRKNERHSYLIG